MQIVIDIDDKIYGLLKYFEKALGLNDKKYGNDDVKTALMRAVINGTPLPEQKVVNMDIREKMFAYFDGLADGMKIAEEDIDLPIKHESKPYLMIPFPDGATNGDMIKALCGDIKVIENKEFMLMTFSKEWWNAPHKKESEDKE